MGVFKRKEKFKIISNQDIKDSIDEWLLNEEIYLSIKNKQRLHGLLSSYFPNKVDKKIIDSFLNHYSGTNYIDFENEVEIKNAIRRILDKGVNESTIHKNNYFVMALFSFFIIISTILYFEYSMYINKPLSDIQQAELRLLVKELSIEKNKTPQSIWIDLKSEFNVSKYKDIKSKDFEVALNLLKE